MSNETDDTKTIQKLLEMRNAAKSIFSFCQANIQDPNLRAENEFGNLGDLADRLNQIWSELVMAGN